jgi:hypothetical protein
VDKNGTILGTAANTRVLKTVDTIFSAEMERAGFSALNRAYAAQFPGQLPYLDQILEQLGASLKVPLRNVRDVLGAEDKRALAAQQTSMVESLSTVVDVVAAGAKRQALFGYAGLGVADLSETLARAFAKTTAQAETIADSAQTGYFRAANDLAFKAIEADLPEMVIRYEYEGPDDFLIRPWCKRLVESGKTYTRAEIDAMNAGPNQPGPVWLFAGGWNCRHGFQVSV